MTKEKKEDSNHIETTTNNPYINKLPSRDICRAIATIGTPEQQRNLEEALAYHKQKDETPDKEGARSKMKAYSKKLSSVKTGQVDLKKEALDFLNFKIRDSSKRPEEITYHFSRSVFWSYFKEIVRKETGEEVKELTPEEVDLFKNYLLWLIGEPGKYDPRKSLYIFGDTGLGKSTLALAGHYLTAFFKARLNWSSRFYDFVSMDEIFLETYSTQNLEKIGRLARGPWCLDELKEKHISYKHYGNEFALLADLLAARYNLWKSEGVNTIITSNIPPRPLFDLLNDERLQDRFKQQYEIILYKGVNRR